VVVETKMIYFISVPAFISDFLQQ